MARRNDPCEPSIARLIPRAAAMRPLWLLENEGGSDRPPLVLEERLCERTDPVYRTREHLKDKTRLALSLEALSSNFNFLRFTFAIRLDESAAAAMESSSHDDDANDADSVNQDKPRLHRTLPRVKVILEDPTVRPC